MGIGKKLAKFRKSKKMTQVELAEKAHISRSYLADVERDRYKPSLDTLEAIADALGISADYLIGQSAGSLIEERLKKMGMSYEELAKQAKVHTGFLRTVDEIIPGPWDYESIERVARVLYIGPNVLRAALARQEPPLYDGPPTSIDSDFINVYSGDCNTIAAHHDAEDWSEEELVEIERFKAFVKSKRTQE